MPSGTAVLGPARTYRARVYEEPTRADDSGNERPPTPAEHLLYVLGQLYRRWYRGQLRVPPTALDILGLARLIGVARDIEMVTQSPDATSYHFAGQVLVAWRDLHFPWWVVSLDDWVLLAELDVFGPTTSAP